MRTKNVIKIIQKAKTKIEKGWCRGSFGRDKNGEDVDCVDPSAVKWCLLGAMEATMPSKEDYGTWEEDYWEAMGALKKSAGISFQGGTLMGWNDKKGRRKRDVVALLDRTIKQLQKDAV